MATHDACHVRPVRLQLEYNGDCYDDSCAPEMTIGELKEIAAFCYNLDTPHSHSPTLDLMRPDGLRLGGTDACELGQVREQLGARLRVVPRGGQRRPLLVASRCWYEVPAVLLAERVVSRSLYVASGTRLHEVIDQLAAEFGVPVHDIRLLKMESVPLGSRVDAWFGSLQGGVLAFEQRP
jgi:hypothetical protein